MVENWLGKMIPQFNSGSSHLHIKQRVLVGLLLIMILCSRGLIIMAISRFNEFIVVVQSKNRFFESFALMSDLTWLFLIIRVKVCPEFQLNSLKYFQPCENHLSLHARDKTLALLSPTLFLSENNKLCARHKPTIFFISQMHTLKRSSLLKHKNSCHETAPRGAAVLV